MLNSQTYVSYKLKGTRKLEDVQVEDFICEAASRWPRIFDSFSRFCCELRPRMRLHLQVLDNTSSIINLSMIKCCIT